MAKLDLEILWNTLNAEDFIIVHNTAKKISAFFETPRGAIEVEAYPGGAVMLNPKGDAKVYSEIDNVTMRKCIKQAKSSWL